MMWGNYSMGYWGWGLGALVLVAIVVTIILLLRFSGGRRTLGTMVGKVDAPTPRQILDTRLAQGELSVKEYQDRVTALSSPRT